MPLTSSTIRNLDSFNINLLHPIHMQLEPLLNQLTVVVRYLKDFLQDDYLASTWRKSLVEHLPWSIDPGFLKRGGYKPCLTTLSWLWASVNRLVRFWGFQPGVKVEVIACSIDPVEKAAPFGQVRVCKKGGSRFRLPY